MFGNKAVACTMEAISSYFVFFVIFIRKSVQISFFRHCLMESGIKYTYHRYARHQFFTCVNADQVGRIVQRRKLVAFFYCFQHLICNDSGRSEFFSAMYDSVSYSSYFVQALDSAGFFIYQSVKNKLDRFFMSRHRSFCDFFVQSLFLVSQTSVDTDRSKAETRKAQASAARDTLSKENSPRTAFRIS